MFPSKMQCKRYTMRKLFAPNKVKVNGYNERFIHYFVHTNIVL